MEILVSGPVESQGALIEMTAALVSPDAIDGVIRFTAEPRSPFVVKRLPALAWLYYLAYRPWRRLQRYFIGKPALSAYRWLRGVGLGGTGIATINIGGQPRELHFDSRNTQFHALYLPQFLPCYEPETTALIDLLVGERDVFFDVGANWGWFALTLASRKGFVGTVHAFEPVSSSFADLTSLVGQAGLAERIVCHELALGDCDGEASMSFSDGVHSGLAKMAYGGSLHVKLARLDTLGLPSPNVIKLDVEEHEFEVLNGAHATIAKGRPFVIFENWVQPDRPKITFAPLELLESWGYRLFFPAWQIGDSGYPYPKGLWSGGAAKLALVPFAPVQRGLLPGITNITAVPMERIGELERRTNSRQ